MNSATAQTFNTNVSEQKTIVVAMSGGVDSSAAACLLAERGHNVIGVAMQVWDYRNHGGNSKRATCCAPADFDDARDVADAKGFPFYVFDFEDSFEEAVINPFVRSYLDGFTPNPCVECNRKVKFKELRRRAASLGYSTVATGHYAQIKELDDRSLGLFTSKDKRKDQSYFLYALTQEELRHTLFPVGGMVKDDVREYLAERSLDVATKAESMDICFVSGSVAEFIEKKSGEKPKSGNIVTTQGEVIGTHEGIHNFTVGQRKGIKGGSPHPLYVLEIDSSTNNVQVGSENELQKREFSVFDINWISGKPPVDAVRSLVKLRYRSEPVLCEIRPSRSTIDANSANDARSTGNATLHFVNNWTAVSPGQAAVFYSTEPDSEGDYQVLGGGTIGKDR